MRPVIKDYLDALTAQPFKKMEGSETESHFYAILRGYHAPELNRDEREHFLNDDVYNLLSRNYHLRQEWKHREWLASPRGRERRKEFEKHGFEMPTPPTELERDFFLSFLLGTNHEKIHDGEDGHQH